MTADLPLRDTARVILMDANNRVFLICYEAARDVDPSRPGLRRFWFTPGGGREEGESYEQAALRELQEETGLTGVELGPVVAVRNAPFLLFKDQRFVRERYFLVRVSTSDLDKSRLAETEDNPVLDTRWWSLNELQMKAEWIEPSGLLEVLTLVIHRKLGPEPVDLSHPPDTAQKAV